MDKIDRQILSILQSDATVPVAEIAERVHLSQTPCWKRIQKLKDAGIIRKQVALCDPQKLGYGTTVFVAIRTNQHNDAWLRKFAAAMQAIPEIVEAYRMSGEVDYLLRVVVADMHSYDLFYKKLIGAIALKNVTSRFAMEKIKSVTALPVPALEPV